MGGTWSYFAVPSFSPCRNPPPFRNWCNSPVTRDLPMSLFFVVVVLLIFSPSACRAFLAHGRQEPVGNAGVGNSSRRGRRSRTNPAFVAQGTSTARGAESVARDAKPRYGCSADACGERVAFVHRCLARQTTTCVSCVA